MMLHKMGYEYTCPECGHPCKDDDFEDDAEQCIGCKGDPEATAIPFRHVRLTESLTAIQPVIASMKQCMEDG